MHARTIAGAAVTAAAHVTAPWREPLGRTARRPMGERVSRSQPEETTMRNPTRTGALASAALVLAVSSAATATDDFRGIWRGTWDNGNETELTVVDIDDQGRALGAYCHLTSQGRTSYVDLHPEDAIRAQLDDGVLRKKHPTRNQHWSFRPEGGIVQMAVRSGDRQPREIDLERVEEQTCAARVHQLTPPPGAITAPTVADLIPAEPEHWAIGVWTADRQRPHHRTRGSRCRRPLRPGNLLQRARRAHARVLRPGPRTWPPRQGEPKENRFQDPRHPVLVQAHQGRQRPRTDPTPERQDETAPSAPYRRANLRDPGDPSLAQSERASRWGTEP